MLCRCSFAIFLHSHNQGKEEGHCNVISSTCSICRAFIAALSRDTCHRNRLPSSHSSLHTRSLFGMVREGFGFGVGCSCYAAACDSCIFSTASCKTLSSSCWDAICSFIVISSNVGSVHFSSWYAANVEKTLSSNSMTNRMITEFTISSAVFFEITCIRH